MVTTLPSLSVGEASWREEGGDMAVEAVSTPPQSAAKSPSLLQPRSSARSMGGGGASGLASPSVDSGGSSRGPRSPFVPASPAPGVGAFGSRGAQEELRPSTSAYLRRRLPPATAPGGNRRPAGRGIALSDKPNMARMIATAPQLSTVLSAEELERAEDHWRELVREQREMRTRHLQSSEEWRRSRDAKARARMAYGRRDYARAVEELNQTLQATPSSDVLHRFRARAHLRLGSPQHAVSDCKAATRLSPSSADNQLLLGVACVHEGQLVEAGRAYARAMQIDASGQRGEAAYAQVLRGIGHRRPFFQTQLHRRPPRLFDTSVEISNPALDMVAHRQLSPPAAPPPPEVIHTGVDAITLRWREPEDDGGDEVFKFLIECSWYDVSWDQKLGTIFDGVREFTPWHEDAARVTERRFEGLAADNWFSFRIKCANSIGESEYSDAVAVHTRTPEPVRREDETVPRAWINTDLSDVVQAHASRVVGRMRTMEQIRMEELEQAVNQATVEQRARSPEERVLADLENVLQDHARELHVCFKLCCVLGSKDGMNVKEMPRVDFKKFVRDAGLVEDKSLTMQQVEFIYQRANMDFRTKQSGEGVRRANDDGASDLMDEAEFINALVRIADWKFGTSPEATFTMATLSERVRYLLEEHVVPTTRAAMPSDDFVAELKSRRVRAILNKHAKALRAAFAAYAAADISSVDARQAADSVNLDELLFMVREGGLLDKSLTIQKVALIFTMVNLENALKSTEELLAEGVPAQALAEGGDDDEDELVYEEWCDVVVRIANEKLPAAARPPDADFALLLDEYLEETLLPKYAQLIKDKKRGLSAKHL